MRLFRLVSPRQQILKFIASEHLKNVSQVKDFPLFPNKKTIFIFPSRRATLYFKYYLGREIARLGQAIILPTTYAFEDLVEEFAIWHDPRPIMHFLDQIWELHKALKEKIKGIPVIESFERFIPWGIQIVTAFEEIEREGINIPESFDLPEGYPVKQLLSLNELWNLWRKGIQKTGKTSLGMRYRTWIESWQKKIVPNFLKSSEIHFAGFTNFGSAEKAFLRAIPSDCDVVAWIESDPEDLPENVINTLNDLGFHEDASTIKRGAQIENSTLPEVSIYEVPDRHHALEKIAEFLSNSTINDAPDRTAILVPDEGILVPLIYELSSVERVIDVNVTLGYPLNRSLVASFVLSLLELHASKTDDSRFFMPSFLHLIRHPYTRIIIGNKSGLAFIESLLQEYGSAYMSSEELKDLVTESLSSLSLEHEEKEVILRTLGVVIEKLLSEFNEYPVNANLQGSLTIKSVFVKIEQILREVTLDDDAFTISEDEKAISGNHKASLEQLFRKKFVDTILKPVINSTWASEPIERIHTAYRLMKETLGVIRIAFSGSPLKGLQVLGFMESNLLSFDEVFILDANEGLLPSRSNRNPFLPEGLRARLGLQTAEQKAMVNRTVFMRLVKSAKRVHLFYTSMNSLQRIGRSSLTGFSGVRSRFVEELLWEIGKSNKSIEEPVIPVPVRIPRQVLKRKDRVPKDPSAEKKLGEILKGSLSASFFNTYLRCPVMFFYRYVLEISNYQSDMEEGLEGRGYRELGTILHETLQNYFGEFPTSSDQGSNRAKITDIFTKLFDSSGLAKRLGRERRFFIKETALHRLIRYLDWFYKNWQPFEVIAQEREFYVNNLVLANRNISLRGKIDLLLIHNDELWIIDFKSTSPGQPKFSWHNDMENIIENYPLSTLRENISDLQLPFYGFLLTKSDITKSEKLAGKPIKACYHVLGASKAEDYNLLLKEDRKETDLRKLYHDIHSALDLLVKHMAECSAFIATEDEDTCEECDYSTICECSMV